MLERSASASGTQNGPHELSPAKTSCPPPCQYSFTFFLSTQPGVNGMIWPVAMFVEFMNK